MALKQQMKGSPAIHYDDFVPKSEWKEEPEANLLLVHLPVFTKEQIRVTYVHSSRSLRITGERPVEGGAKRWSRFNKAFPVPQNCVVEKIHGSFKDNILTVTMPKQTITKIPNTTPITTTTTTTSTLIEPGKDSTLKTPATSSETPTVEKTDGNGTVLRPSSTQTPPAVATTVKNIESNESNKALEDPKKEKKDEKLPSRARETPSDPATTTIAKTTETKKEQENSYPGQVSRVQDGIEKDKKVDSLGSDRQREPAVSGIESGKAARRITKKDMEKKGKGMMDLAMDTVKKIRGMEMSEEKLLMVNVGVAAIVIFALGAYVSYTFTSSSSSSSSGNAQE